jgi:hypothetical protein
MSVTWLDLLAECAGDLDAMLPRLAAARNSTQMSGIEEVLFNARNEVHLSLGRAYSRQWLAAQRVVPAA